MVAYVVEESNLVNFSEIKRLLVESQSLIDELDSQYAKHGLTPQGETWKLNFSIFIEKVLTVWSKF